MAFYEIKQGTPAQREEVSHKLIGLDELSPDMREKVITAWVTVWLNSSYESLDDVPFAQQHRLMEHVNEVTRFGMSLARAAMEQWGKQWSKQLDWQELVQALILHDLDKPILFSSNPGNLDKPAIFAQIPHGVLGAMILNELGFSDSVVSTVATHSPASPLRPSTVLSYLICYADLFSADHALLEEGLEAYYQKHIR